MNVTLDIPNFYLLSQSAEELGKQLKLHSALLRFHAGEISAGAACEFAEVDHFTFYEACKKHQIPVVRYEIEEVIEEVGRIAKKLRS